MAVLESLVAGVDGGSTFACTSSMSEKAAWITDYRPPYDALALLASDCYHSCTCASAIVPSCLVVSCHRAIMPPRVRAVVHRAADAAIASSRHHASFARLSCATIMSGHHRAVAP